MDAFAGGGDFVDVPHGQRGFAEQGRFDFRVAQICEETIEGLELAGGFDLRQDDAGEFWAEDGGDVVEIVDADVGSSQSFQAGLCNGARGDFFGGGDGVFEIEDDAVRAIFGGLFDPCGPMAGYEECGTNGRHDITVSGTMLSCPFKSPMRPGIPVRRNVCSRLLAKPRFRRFFARVCRLRLPVRAQG